MNQHTKNTDIEIISPLQDQIEQFHQLIAKTPRDNLGFLTYLLDYTKLPPKLNNKSKDKQNKHLQTAKIPLSMATGYLAHSFSQPIWSPLPHEPQTYFDLFRIYLSLPERLHQHNWHDNNSETNKDIPINERPTRAELGTRPLNIIKQNYPQLEPNQLEEMYTFYYWKDRALAYDLQKKVAAAQLTEQRVIDTEDQDYHFSSKMLGYLGHEISARIEDSITAGDGGRVFKGLHTKDLMAVAGQMIEIRRVSLNLPAKGPQTKSDPYLDRGASTHTQLQQAVQRSDPTTLDNTNSSTQKQLEKAIANDPERAAKIQELAMELLQAQETNNE